MEKEKPNVGRESVPHNPENEGINNVPRPTIQEPTKLGEQPGRAETLLTGRGDRQPEVLNRLTRAIYGAESFDTLNDRRKESIRGALEASKLGFDEFIRTQREKYGSRLTPRRPKTNSPE